MKEMIESMNLLLEELRKHKSLDNKTINQLRLDPNHVQLSFIIHSFSFPLFLPGRDCKRVRQTLPSISIFDRNNDIGPCKT